MNSVDPLAEASCTIPLTRPRNWVFSGSTNRPSRCVGSVPCHQPREAWSSSMDFTDRSTSSRPRRIRSRIAASSGRCRSRSAPSLSTTRKIARGTLPRSGIASARDASGGCEVDLSTNLRRVRADTTNPPMAASSSPSSCRPGFPSRGRTSSRSGKSKPGTGSPDSRMRAERQGEIVGSRDLAPVSEDGLARQEGLALGAHAQGGELRDDARELEKRKGMLIHGAAPGESSCSSPACRGVSPPARQPPARRTRAPRRAGRRDGGTRCGSRRNRGNGRPRPRAGCPPAPARGCPAYR